MIESNRRGRKQGILGELKLAAPIERFLEYSKKAINKNFDIS